MELIRAIRENKLIICVGSGGVGKTTTSATIALRAAMEGRKAIVLTIDPARRLANSLGLDAMGGEARRVDLSGLNAPGELWGMMLDPEHTFDTLIGRIAASEEARDRILSNSIYRHLAQALAGSQDYMATEQLYDLVASGDYDLVVLDTPPVKNALDFLESPGLVASFLNQQVLSWFLKPLEAGNRSRLGRWMLGATSVIYKLLGVVFGEEFVQDFANFLQDFNGLFEGFQARHKAVVEMFRASGTDFVSVCAPSQASLDIAQFFEDELSARELPRLGVVINQVHHAGASDTPPDSLVQALSSAGDAARAEFLAAASQSHRDLRVRAEEEGRLTAPLRATAPFLELPKLERDVYDLPALSEIARLLG